MMFNKQMNFVDAGNVTQAFDKEAGMKKQIDVVNAELSKLRNMCNAFAPISMKIETDEKDAH